MILPTRRIRIAVCLSLLAIAACCLTYRILYARPKEPPVVTADNNHPNATPVLVELFTSEGCSSCPPADALLLRLDRDQPVPGADIIVLEEHVDYWDSLGWKDRFSSPYLTQRQKQYGTYFKLDDVYTPQTVVNGYLQFNGTDSRGIQSAIEKAAVTNKAVPLQFTGVKVQGSSVTFTLQPGPPVPEYIRVYAALVDPEDTTEVPAGENKGRILHHAGVVRAFSLSGESWHMQALGKGPFGIQSNVPAIWNEARHEYPIVDGTRLVVFAQVKPIGPVLGMVSCIIGPETRTATPNPQTPLPPNRCPPAGI